MNSHFLQLFTYNQWASNRLLDTLEVEGVTDEKILMWMSHISNAECIWWDRIQGKNPRMGVFDTYSLGVCREKVTSFHREILPWIKVVAPNDFDRHFSYQNSKGKSFSNSIREVLSHMINHGTHHRAQISARLRQVGIVPPPTDFIFFARG
ncbi:MAG: DinB family protein [Bacteroidota bacterium]